MSLSLVFFLMIVGTLGFLLTPLAPQRAPYKTDTYLRSRVVAGLFIGLLLPLGAMATYYYLGSPELPARPYAERKNDPEFLMATETEKLATQLEAKPDAAGYARLGDAYSILRRFDKAVEAYQKAAQLDASNANVWSELGEAIGLAENGMVSPEARAAFSKALRLDPHESRARFYLGLAALQDKDPRHAIAIWRDLVKDSGADAPWTAMIKRKIAAVAKKAGFDPGTIAPEPPTLTSPDAAEAILSLAPADQNAAIRAMVERLAERLKNNPDDPEGWARLAKSYAVLGETAKARDAQSHLDALKAKGQNK